MTLQHSPGPFMYVKEEEMLCDANGIVIADLFKSPHHGDGHLFAAAPGLLEALELMLREYGCRCGESGCDMCRDSEIARAAIRKAKGE